jgi:hypothetical protein
MKGQTMPSKEDIRTAAENDLLTFIRLIAPHRVLGKCHEDMVKWWTRDNSKDHQMVLFPRDHQKSAMVAYRVAWEITRNPAVTVLYISSTSNLAQKQLKFIKDILEHPKYRRYWPDMIHPDEGKREKWTTEEISVDHPIRQQEGVRDPTVFTAGLTTSITGLHCNIAVLDDVVVNENAYTTDGRDKVESQYSLLASIETTDAKEWIVGTRYHPKDLYGTLLVTTEDVVDEDGEIIDSELMYEVLQREVEDMGDGTGEYLWPRMQRGDGRWFGFNPKVLATKRAKYLDKTQFHAQYYNNPNDPGEEAIGGEYFQYYNREFLRRSDGVWLYQGKPLSVFAAIDFAYTLRKQSDYTALVVVGADSDGQIYILDIKRERTNKVDKYYDMVREAHLKWGFKKVRAECTAAQSVIAERIRDEIRKDGLLLSVDEYKPTRTMGTKEERIHNELSPRYQNYSIWHYYGGLCEDLEMELRQHNPAFDDLKDALHSVMGIVKTPMNRQRMKRTSNVVTHSRFGGVM